MINFVIGSLRCKLTIKTLGGDQQESNPPLSDPNRKYCHYTMVPICPDDFIGLGKRTM